jgi:hypothetical protein
MNTAWTRLQSLINYLPSKAYNGYTLFAPMESYGVWLIDMQGRFVHHWDMTLQPGLYGTLLPNGHLLYAGKLPDALFPEFGGISGKLIEVDWDGNLVWEYKDPYMHHDFHRLPNGNTLTLRWVATPGDIVSKVKGGIPGTEREGVMWADSLREVTPKGEVVWEWLSYEHLDPETDAICPLCYRAEWTHTNACFPLSDGNILVCPLTLNTILIIDKASGDIKWRWGKGELAHPHDANMLENGNILVFDNGSHRPSTPESPYGWMAFSRVLEVDPKSGSIVWEFKDQSQLRFYASFISGCQRLPNGNTLICEGPTGRFFEVTPDKELVWEYVNPFFSQAEESSVEGWHNTVFRAYRYGPDYPGLAGKELDPDKFELTLKAKPMEKEEVLKKRIGRLGY